MTTLELSTFYTPSTKTYGVGFGLMGTHVTLVRGLPSLEVAMEHFKEIQAKGVTFVTDPIMLRNPQTKALL